MAKAKTTQKKAQAKVSKGLKETSTKKTKSATLKKASAAGSSSKRSRNGRSNLKSRVTAKALKRAEQIDQLLLKLAPEPYAKLLQGLASGKKKISEERQIALDIGARILSRAKDVRDTLMAKAGLK